MELFSYENITQILLIVAVAIFLIVTIRSKKIKSFQFQISIFVLIWLAGVMVNLLYSEHREHSDLGMYIHLASMVFLLCILWIRFYFSKKRIKKIIEVEDDNSK